MGGGIASPVGSDFERRVSQVMSYSIVGDRGTTVFLHGPADQPPLLVGISYEALEDHLRRPMNGHKAWLVIDRNLRTIGRIADAKVQAGEVVYEGDKLPRVDILAIDFDQSGERIADSILDAPPFQWR
jgi:hypothetical protein